MSTSGRRVLIAAGGTGGHVFPALAVAEALSASGCQVAWLGTRNGLESRVVSRAGIQMFSIAARGLRGKRLSRLITAPLMLGVALFQSIVALLRFRPHVVLGMGGYVAGPGGVAAWILRRPLVIHEQNAVAGMTNRILCRVATRVMEAFPNSFPGAKSSAATLTGNPVRAAIAARGAQPRSVPESRVHLLVFGGSQGAEVLNELVPVALAQLHRDPEFRKSVQVIHQAGAGRAAATEERYREVGVEAEVVEFIESMDAAYSHADIAICRAGAMTIAELAVMGLPSVLVPYPHAVDDHQTRNAEFLSDRGAAVTLVSTTLSAPQLAHTLAEILNSAERLGLMSERARECARPDATRVVAELCLEAARHEA